MLSLAATTFLGIAFGVLAIMAVALQAWLWRFPMRPDPTGVDPHGVSTAPKLWTNVHRAVGYVFLIDYLVLLVVMVPRLWSYPAIPPLAWVHIVLGILVGAILTWKILVIRRYRALGNWLPWLGGSLLGLTVLSLALTVPAAYGLQSTAAVTPGLAMGRAVVTTKCVSCHGANVVLREGRTPDGWRRTTEEMMDRATESGRVLITPDEANAAAAYLTAAAPGSAGGPEERESHERDDD